MHAANHDANAPPIIALNDNFAKSFLLFGAILLNPPICIPIEPKLAKPHKA